MRRTTKSADTTWQAFGAPTAVNSNAGVPPERSRKQTRPFDLLAGFLAIIWLPSLVSAQSHVVITGYNVNIRTAPNGEVINQARPGDVFENGEKDGDWLAIFLFSGEHRYVQVSLARATDLVPEQPDEATRRQAFQALIRAERRATAEADSQIPPTTLASIERNIDLQRILDDRCKLDVCHQFEGIQPAHYTSLAVEGVGLGWTP